MPDLKYNKDRSFEKHVNHIIKDRDFLMLLMTVAEMRDRAVDGNTEGAEVDNHWSAASIRAIFCGKNQNTV